MLKNSCLVCSTILLAICTLSCSEPDYAATEIAHQNENILRIDIAAPLGSFSQTEVSALGSSLIFPLFYSFLFVPDQEGALTPDLAVRWEYDPDRFIWTIHLRDDAFFHNGRRVTAWDVEYSLVHSLQPSFPDLFSTIERIICISDTSLHICLKKNDPDFPSKIWDQSITTDPGEKEIDSYDPPIGSGPFKFDYRIGEREIGLVANDGYYGGRPSLDRVIFFYRPNSEDSWARLLSGKTDVVYRLNPKDFEILSRYRDRFRFDTKVPEYYMILLFNTADPLFSNPDVRLALASAVDRERIINTVYHGFATLAVGPAGVNSPYHNPALKPVPYNPERAMELLHRAGWTRNTRDQLLYRNGQCFEFTAFIFKGNLIDRRVAEHLQLFLSEVGIKMHLQSLAFEELVERYCRNNQFQAVLTEFSSSPRMIDRLVELWKPANGKGSAAGLFHHPEVSRLLNEAVATEDPHRRKKCFQEADTLIASLQPGIFLFHKGRLNVMSKRLQLPSRFSFDQAGIYRLKNAFVPGR
jgi:peptide/nickel transport system substrate-binding protein